MITHSKMIISIFIYFIYVPLYFINNWWQLKNIKCFSIIFQMSNNIYSYCTFRIALSLINSKWGQWFFLEIIKAIWLKNKKIHSSSKNDLAMTWRSLNDIFFGINLVKGNWIRGPQGHGFKPLWSTKLVDFF
jgi:hypothetical protein